MQLSQTSLVLKISGAAEKEITEFETVWLLVQGTSVTLIETSHTTGRISNLSSDVSTPKIVELPVAFGFWFAFEKSAAF
jgi:hypothetical protein